MADINYTLNLFFHETAICIFQKHYGLYWYENELLPSMNADFQNNESAPTILKDYITGKKNKKDLDVSILSRYLLFDVKYSSILTKMTFDYLHILRKDRNILGHESLSITQEQKRRIIIDIINSYNAFNDIIFSETLVKNLNDLASLYGFTNVQMRKIYINNSSSSSENNNKKNSQTTNSNSNTERHWWEKDIDVSQRFNDQQINNSGLHNTNTINKYPQNNNQNIHYISPSKLSKGSYTLCILALIGLVITCVVYINRPTVLLVAVIVFFSLIFLFKTIDGKNKTAKTRRKQNNMIHYKGNTINVACPKCGKKTPAPDTNGDINLKCFHCEYEFLFSSVDVNKNKAVKKCKFRLTGANFSLGTV